MRGSSNDSGDVLELLLASGDLSDSEIRDQVVTLIAAGYDTTASSLAWTLLRAAGTPGVWARLRAEADSALGTIGTSGLGPATLQQLPYAKAVVRETLRLHPAGVFSPCQATRDIAIGSHTIRKGSFILLCPYLAGRDPSSWPDPLRSIPTVTSPPTDATLRSIPRGFPSGAARGTASASPLPRWSSSSSWHGSRNDSTSTSRPGRCRSRTGWL